MLVCASMWFDEVVMLLVLSILIVVVQHVVVIGKAEL